MFNEIVYYQSIETSIQTNLPSFHLLINMHRKRRKRCTLGCIIQSLMSIIHTEKGKRRKKNGTGFMVNVPEMKFIISDFVTVDSSASTKARASPMHPFTHTQSTKLI